MNAERRKLSGSLSMLPLALTLLAAFGGTASAQESSRITSVVAFPDHAEVTRELRVRAQAGTNQARFVDLVPSIFPKSLRASGTGGARITGTEIHTSHLETSSPEEVAELERSIQELRDEISLVRRSQKRQEEQADFYKSIKGRLGRDVEEGIATGRVSVEEWTELIAFVDEGLTACDVSLAELAVEIRGLEARLGAAEAERESYTDEVPQKRKDVTVSFTAEVAGEVTIQIHYMVAQVAWRPSYDVHLDRASGELEVIGYGHVQQWTGEPWEDVQLTLAMSGADQGLDVPELSPVVASLDQEAMNQLTREVAFLQRMTRTEVANWIETRFQSQQEREVFRRSLERLSISSAEQLQKLGLSHVMIEEALRLLVDRFAAVRYDVEQRATIPFDNSPHKLVTFRGRLPVGLRYVATPALGDSVMLRGVVTNATGHPILDGPAALFVDESYVGTSSANAAAENEALSFGFGPDDALSVRRRLVSRQVKGPEDFRQSQILTYEYELTIENFNDTAVEVDVADQVPISRTDNIKVSLLSSSHDHRHDEATGQLSWTTQVAPGATATITYSFSVECPVGRHVHWQ